MPLFRTTTRSRHRRGRGWRLGFERLEGRVLLAVDIVGAGDGVALIDMGLDPRTGAVTLVGAEEEAGEQIAKVFYLNAARDSLASATLVGLGPNTQVFGIASDGSRIAGISDSPESIDGEGTIWLSTAPDSPIGIGFVDGKPKASNAVGAWQGGVVGQFNGGDGAITWTETVGIQILAGNPGDLQDAVDVSADGTIQVGSSTLGNLGADAVYWDATGIHPLDASVGLQSKGEGISPSGNFIGGWIFYLAADQSTSVLQAVVWDADRNIIRLTDSSGAPFEGIVTDVSNHGYAVGVTKDNEGFIWHESFAEPLIFDDWLETKREAGDPSLPSASTSVVAIAEDILNGKLLFAVNGSAYFVQVDAPELIAQWHNLAMPLDVTGDNLISPLDVLVIINALNNGGARPLRPPRTGDFSYDTNGDGTLSPIDALLVINFLNGAGSGEGEAAPLHSLAGLLYVPSPEFAVGALKATARETVAVVNERFARPDFHRQQLASTSRFDEPRTQALSRRDQRLSDEFWCRYDPAIDFSEVIPLRDGLDSLERDA
ncbi:MAG: dockerin type I domain-containing protein [Planctomycetota bacterium]|nr:dockerin type I domain-containing protein [Planctomycetota bacterium]